MMQPFRLRDYVECLTYLVETVHSTLEHDQALLELAMVPLQDRRFLESPAAKEKHHAYEGGLVVHTAQVMAASLAMLECIEEAHVMETVVAVIWHDFGKIWDYKLIPAHEAPRKPKSWEQPRMGRPDMVRAPASYTYTEHRDQISHLPRSYAEFAQRAEALPEEQRTFIGHLILSHHGRREWGSPVRPATPEAWAIHAADMLSSQYSADSNVTASMRN